MTEATVSVAMATYNGERFLQEQLESLARQTLLPCELVASDDGSTDATLEILRNFANTSPFPVRIYQNETRLGYGPNFLRAASLCSGTLIAFCDQDDVWLAPKLRRCAAVMENPEIGLVIHSAEVVNESLTPLGIRTSRIQHPVCLDAGAKRVWRPLGQHMSEILDWVRGCTCVVRSEVFNRVPPAPPLAGPGLPHEKWLQFASEVTGSVTLLPDLLMFYRQHERNAIGFRKRFRHASEFTASFNLGSAEFSIWAKNAAAYARILADAAARSPDIRPRLMRAQRWYETKAKSMELRAALYAEAATQRGYARRLFTAARSGAYSSRRQGGFGIRGLARDILMPLLRRTVDGRREHRQRLAEGLAGPQQTAPDRQSP